MDISKNLDSPDMASTHHEHTTGKFIEGDEIARIDAMADAPGVTMATFAHLDEKKILRKVQRNFCHGTG
jgi:hypothetical protein